MPLTEPVSPCPWKPARARTQAVIASPHAAGETARLGDISGIHAGDGDPSSDGPDVKGAAG